MSFSDYINFIFVTTATGFIFVQLIVTFLWAIHRFVLIQFCFSRVSPFHTTILEPNLHLERKCNFNYLSSRTLLYSVQYLTCASVRPKRAANFRRSGFVMYFWIWNWISRPFRCNWLNTARDHERFRFEFPLLVCIDGLSVIDMWERCRPAGLFGGLLLLYVQGWCDTFVLCWWNFTKDDWADMFDGEWTGRGKSFLVVFFTAVYLVSILWRSSTSKNLKIC